MRARVAAIVLTGSVLLAAPAAAGAEPAPVQRTAGPDRPASPQRAGATATTSAPMGPRRLQRRLRNLARKAPGASGFLAQATGAGGARVLFKRSAGKRRRLASNTKLFTTATALDRLGHRRRIETRAFAQGAVNGYGRLEGNVYLVGGGDPSLGAAGMAALAEQVKAAGIRRIGGHLVGDDTVFDRRRGVPDSNWAPSPYIAPLSGLVYGGSTYSGDPAATALKAFSDALKARGVRVSGERRIGRLPARAAGRRPIATYASSPIAALVATTNKDSHNFYAEMLLKRLWAQPGRRGTTRGGARAVRSFATAQGSGIRARDGSGLTRGNRASPREVVRLLVAMRRHRAAGPFFRSLSIAGRDGTLAKRMRGSAANRRCRGKTGTLRDVSTLSGYCNVGGDRKIAFSLLMNGVASLEGAQSVQDRMVAAIARYGR